MRTKLLTALLILGGLGCATITHLEAKAGISGAQETEEKCGKVASGTVPDAEERAFGDTVGVALVSKFGGAKVTVPESDDFKDPEKVKIADVPDNRLASYVATVGKSLARLSDRPQLRWTFGVIDSDDINAFSAPGGWVFLSRGLIRRLPDEAALAGVLGHEIAHVTLRHAMETYKSAKYDTCVAVYSKGQGASVASVVAGSVQDTLNALFLGKAINLNDPKNYEFLADVVDGAVNKIVGAGFDRKLELQADQGGLLLAMRAGYNPDSFVNFIATIPAGGNAIMAHHPSPADRKAALENWRKELAPKIEFATADEIARYPAPPLGHEVAALDAP